MHPRPRHSLPSLLLGLSLLLAGVSSGQALPLIRADSVSVAGNQLVIVATDHGSGAAGYRLERSGTMIGAWQPAGASPSVSGNRITFTLARPADARFFYRVVGINPTGTPGDTDGDGLSDLLEDTNSYSDPILFDTDGDGFNDGVEYAHGTDPRSGASKPDQGALPQAGFTSLSSSVLEGSGTHQIPVTISSSFGGTVHYTVERAGDPAPPVGGTTTASGGAASIPFSITDDALVEPQERLYLVTLTKNPPGGLYNPSGAVTHVVCVEDNDAYWSGVLMVEAGAPKADPAALEAKRDQASHRTFRACITRLGASVAIAFTSGSSDGLLQPDGGASSQSTGVIPDTNLAGLPQEVFGSLTNIRTSTRFEALTPQLPVATAGFLDSAPLQRQISFVADTTGSDPVLLTEHRIVGRFTDTVTHVAPASGPTPTYLASEVKGAFALVKDFPQPAGIPSPLAP